MRRALLLTAAVALVAGCGGSDDDDAPAERPAAQGQRASGPIAAADIREHLEALQAIARRNRGHRAASTPGERATADYIADKLKEAGWQVRTQDVRWPIFENRRRPVLGNLRYRRDFEELEFSGSAEITGRVNPFDTRACKPGELGELTKQDIAIVARGTCTFRAKALAAQRAGAGAVVVVDRKATRPPLGTLGDPAGIDIPVISVTGDAGERLAREQGDVRVLVDSVSKTNTTRNVIAETRPADRVVMAGGHLDGVRAGPGMNDNGTGIAALLEIAERLRDRPGLRLGFWTAEEIGLFGSREYVKQLSRPERSRLRAYINLDMVGTRKPDLQVYDSDNDVEEALRDAVDEDGEADLSGESDHAPFQNAKIPIGGIYTGTDRCYHRACDTLRNPDPAVAAEVARATQEALSELAR